jgi:hypothetical protein
MFMVFLLSKFRHILYAKHLKTLIKFYTTIYCRFDLNACSFLLYTINKPIKLNNKSIQGKEPAPI